MKQNKTRTYFNIIISIFLISLLVNVYMSVKENSYRKRIYSKSYSSIQEIWNKNVDINKTLEVAVKDGKLKKGELIKLKQTYDVILEKSLSLIDDYTFYSNQEVFNIGSEYNTKNNMLSDNYMKLKPYLSKLIEDNMYSSNEYIYINGKDSVCFNKLYDLSKDTNSYYEKLVKNNSEDGTFDGLKNKLSKDKFLNEFYKELNEINLKYKNVDFSVQDKK